MFYSTILLAASAFSGLVAAQTSIDPNSVSATTRSSWCRAETNTCPVLCGGSFSNNTCDSNTLDYSCVCNNGLQPNMSKYENTIPMYVCQEWKAECNSNNAGNSTAQSACAAVQCGTASASNLVASSTAASSSAAASSSGGSASTTAASSATGSSSASGSASSSTSTGAATALSVGKEYGAGVLAAGLFGLFAYAL